MRSDHQIMYFIHGFHCSHISYMLAQNPHSVACCLILQQVIASCARLYEVNSREDTFVGQLAIELQLGITSTFEFLEDYFIHLRTSIRQSCCNDSQ